MIWEEGGLMKRFAFLVSVAALIACSESENIADVDGGDDIAQEGSSLSEVINSSATENSQVSSSSALLSATSSATVNASLSSASLSSDSKEGLSSSSYYLDFLDTGIPGRGVGGGCVASFSASNGAAVFPDYAWGTDGFRPEELPRSINGYQLLIEGRTAKLIADGTPAESAEKTAKKELIAALGLDTLFVENPLTDRSTVFSRADVENTLNYFFDRDTVATYKMVKSFSEKGTLDRSEYCGIWNVSPSNSWGGEESAFIPYRNISLWARTIGQPGCAATGFESVPPTYILNNIYRKCIGLPYCDGKQFGIIEQAGLKNIIADTLYYCGTSGWTLLMNYEDDTKDNPCDEIGKMFKSTSLKERYYVCKGNGWNVATKMDYETKDVPCGDSAKVIQSPTDTTRFYLCKNSEWKIATQIEKETTGIPCDRIGKMIESEWSNQSNGGIFYICRESGWDRATYREMDIGDRACDAEGKTIQGLRDTSMFYVCFQNVWVDFNEAPCDTDNKRLRNRYAVGDALYICYNGKWHFTAEWSCEFPKEYYFNPDIEYGTLIDERDGETYRTVVHNGYTWMAENLRYVTPNASQSIPVEEGCEIAGRFYSKEAALVACPAGWKLPDSMAVYSLETKEYNHLSPFLQNCYNEQFVSDIGSRCNGFDCNTKGTSFLPLGTSKKPNAGNGPENTRYWSYSYKNPGDLWAFGFAFIDMSFFYVDEDELVPIRCVKE